MAIRLIKRIFEKVFGADQMLVYILVYGREIAKQAASQLRSGKSVVEILRT